MSLLEQATVPESGPFFGTIAGDPGLGKSSMAAKFPIPIFLAVEDGVGRIKEDIRPNAIRVQSLDTLRSALAEIRKEDHEYETMVIDSVTALEYMIIEHIVSNDTSKPASINQACGGYGAGPNAVASMHDGIRKYCKAISDERGMNVVFIAHADTETLDLPDKEPFMRYSFRMSKKSVKPYIDDVNLVGFVRQEMFITGTEGQRVKKARGTGDRIFDCVPSACTVAKNAYQITEELPYPEGTNPLAEYI